MGKVCVCVLLITLLYVSGKGFCIGERMHGAEGGTPLAEMVKGGILPGQLVKGVNECVEQAEKKQEYSACDQCLRLIYIGGQCIEWKSFEGTALNICFCNEECFTEAKNKYPFLDREKFHVKKADHVVVGTEIILKCLFFGFLDSRVFFEPIEVAKDIDRVKSKKEKSFKEKAYLTAFTYLCITK